MSDKIKMTTKQLKEALLRFQEVLDQEENEFIRDASIQRFEFTFELFWKLLKSMLAETGIIVYSPRDSIKEGFSVGFIDEDSVWIKMLETRNSTVHLSTYE